MAEKLGFEQAVLDRISQMVDPMADAMADAMGLPPAAKKYSEREQLEMWNYSPEPSPQKRVEWMLSLKMQGQSNEQITDAVYPNRRTLVTSGRPNVTEQIKFAKEMRKLMERKATEAGMQMPTDPGTSADSFAVEMPMPEAMPIDPMSAPTPMDAAMPMGMPEPAAPQQPSVPSPLDMPISSLGAGF